MMELRTEKGKIEYIDTELARVCPFCKHGNGDNDVYLRRKKLNVEGDRFFSYVAVCRYCCAVGPYSFSANQAVGTWNGKDADDFSEDDEYFKRLRD